MEHAMTGQPHNMLAQICADKADYVRRCAHYIPEIVHRERAKTAEPPRGFYQAIREKKSSGLPALIAEVKKASPSQGIIRADFDPVRIARIYQESGAACISVLTDQPYFKGADEDLEAVKSTVAIPVLRKDFMISPYQIIESRALGADCVLLIMAALDDALARNLYRLATELGMDVLVEVHDEAELDRAMKLDPVMVGVNARNLSTLQVDIETSFKLLSRLPSSVLRVAESGISAPEVLRSLHDAGYDAFLVGEHFMRQNDIGAAVKKLLGNDAESA